MSVGTILITANRSATYTRKIMGDLNLVGIVDVTLAGREARKIN